MNRSLRLATGLVLTMVFAWLVFRQIGIDALQTAFRGARPACLVAALAAFALGYACRIQRWRLMLTRDNPALRWRDCAPPLMGAVAMNNLLPFRAGDAIRAFAFNDRLGTTVATSIAALLVERLLDLLMVVILLGIALACSGLDASKSVGIGGPLSLAIAAAALVFLMRPTVLRPGARWVTRAASRVFPRIGNRIQHGSERLFAALADVSGRRLMPRLLLWSVGAWLAEGALFWAAAYALPSIVAPQAAWLALPVGTLATLIPSAPGYAGTFDFFTAQAMALLGNPIAAATAYALLVHALLWLPATLVGGVLLLAYPRRAMPAKAGPR
jgi:uncharacterized protein (TIRG00374 family)